MTRRARDAGAERLPGARAPTLTSSASPLAVSGPISLSLQSSLHLSLTVLVRYRSLADI